MPAVTTPLTTVSPVECSSTLVAEMARVRVSVLPSILIETGCPDSTAVTVPGAPGLAEPMQPGQRKVVGTPTVPEMVAPWDGVKVLPPFSEMTLTVLAPSVPPDCTAGPSAAYSRAVPPAAICPAVCVIPPPEPAMPWVPWVMLRFCRAVMVPLRARLVAPGVLMTIDWSDITVPEIALTPDSVTVPPEAMVPPTLETTLVNAPPLQMVPALCVRPPVMPMLLPTTLPPFCANPPAMETVGPSIRPLASVAPPVMVTLDWPPTTAPAPLTVVPPVVAKVMSPPTPPTTQAPMVPETAMVVALSDTLRPVMATGTPAATVSRPASVMPTVPAAAATGPFTVRATLSRRVRLPVVAVKLPSAAKPLVAWFNRTEVPRPVSSPPEIVPPDWVMAPPARRSTPVVPLMRPAVWVSAPAALMLTWPPDAVPLMPKSPAAAPPVPTSAVRFTVGAVTIPGTVMVPVEVIETDWLAALAATVPLTVRPRLSISAIEPAPAEKLPSVVTVVVGGPERLPSKALPALVLPVSVPAVSVPPVWLMPTPA